MKTTINKAELHAEIAGLLLQVENLEKLKHRDAYAVFEAFLKFVSTYPSLFDGSYIFEHTRGLQNDFDEIKDYPYYQLRDSYWLDLTFSLRDCIKSAHNRIDLAK